MAERLLPVLFGSALLLFVMALPWVLAWYSSRRAVRQRMPLR